jgi:U1 small nuclear ribonucleoprotein
LPYFRPVDKDITRVTSKNVSGVGALLAQIKEDNTAGLFKDANRDGMEEGEEPVYTLAEETKREIRREERKKKREDDLVKAKENCQSTVTRVAHRYLTLPFR